MKANNLMLISGIWIRFSVVPFFKQFWIYMPNDNEYNDEDNDDHQWHSHRESNLFLESATTFFVLILKSTKGKRHLGEGIPTNCFPVLLVTWSLFTWFNALAFTNKLSKPWLMRVPTSTKVRRTEENNPFETYKHNAKVVFSCSWHFRHKFYMKLILHCHSFGHNYPTHFGLVLPKF